MAQYALCLFQAFGHGCLTLKRLDEHTVLDRFLHEALHLGVGRAYLAGEPPHLSDIDLAHGDEYGDDGDGDNSQHGIHGEEIAKRADEHGKDGERVGNGLGEEGHYIVHVELQSVEDITGVELLFAVPLCAQDTVEHPLLHAVLCPDAKDVAHPRACYGEKQSCHHEQCHDDDGDDDAVGTAGMSLQGGRRHVDSMLHGSYLRQ